MNASIGSGAPSTLASAHGSSLPVLVVLIAVIVLGFIVFCLVDLARTDDVRYLPKWAWALIIIFTHILGGALYLIVGRKR